MRSILCLAGNALKSLSFRFYFRTSQPSTRKHAPWSRELCLLQWPFVVVTQFWINCLSREKLRVRLLAAAATQATMLVFLWFSTSKIKVYLLVFSADLLVAWKHWMLWKESKQTKKIDLRYHFTSTNPGYWVFISAQRITKGLNVIDYISLSLGGDKVGQGGRVCESFWRSGRSCK